MAACRAQAMVWLARREYGRSEMARRLAGQGFDSETIDAVIADLVEHDWLSDERYADSFLRSRLGKGHGPHRVMREARERGLDESLLDDAIERAEPAIDWSVIAEDVLSKRFGEAPCADRRDWAKRERFMQYRGFSGEHYRHLLKMS